MKDKDKARKDALSLLLAALKNKAIDKRADLTEEEENAVIFREIKQAQETVDTTPADRTQIIEEAKLRIFKRIMVLLGIFVFAFLIQEFYYFYYYYYISSTSDHQALDPRGWGPLF